MVKKSKAKRRVGFASARVEKLIRDSGAFHVSADAISRLNEVLTNCIQFNWRSWFSSAF